jgi:hypothetical protein
MAIIGRWPNTSKEILHIYYMHVHPHTQDQTQYRQPTVKEHDHHLDSQQDFN